MAGEGMRIKREVKAKIKIKIRISICVLSTVCCLLSAIPVSSEENPCLLCHSRFSVIAKAVHAPLGMGCETCHQPEKGMEHPQQKGSMKLVRDVPALCYGCHDESKFNGKFVHFPVSMGTCTGCHNPHQSEFSKILISVPPNLCYSCHENKATKKYVHAPAATGQCLTCHNSHVSGNTALLMSPVNKLCTDCHPGHATGIHILAGLQGAHPVKGRPDPSRPGRNMSCASCHDPHNSDFPKLMLQKGLCQRCHKY